MSTQVSTQFTTGHIGLNVNDLERSNYQDVSGFTSLRSRMMESALSRF